MPYPSMRTTEVSELVQVTLDHESWFPSAETSLCGRVKSEVTEDSFCPVAYDGARF